MRGIFQFIYQKIFILDFSSSIWEKSFVFLFWSHHFIMFCTRSFPKSFGKDVVLACGPLCSAHSWLALPCDPHFCLARSPTPPALTGSHKAVWAGLRWPSWVSSEVNFVPRFPRWGLLSWASFSGFLASYHSSHPTSSVTWLSSCLSCCRNCYFLVRTSGYHFHFYLSAAVCLRNL